MKRKLELVILVACGVLGLVWATTTSHFAEDWYSLDYLIDASSLLTVASFAVRGMLPLRALAAASQIIAIPYFMFQPTPMWTPVGWTALFLAINLYHITRILLERRPVRFTPEERQLYDLTFQSFEPRDFLKLVEFGEWKTATRGDKLLNRGAPVEHIAVPIAGTVSATYDKEQIVQLGPGDLIGAGIGLTDLPSEFDAECLEDARYICWQVTAIQSFFDRHSELAPKFSHIVNHYLVDQINRLSLYIAERDRGDR